MLSAICEGLRSNPPCAVILFAINYLSVHGPEALSRLGLRIPNHLAVVSFDELDLFRLYSPTITVIAQPIEMMAENITNALPRVLEGRHDKVSTTQMQLLPTLLIRQSSIGRLP